MKDVAVEPAVTQASAMIGLGAFCLGAHVWL